MGTVNLQSVSTEIRLGRYTTRRLDRIEAVLGADVYKEIEEVDRELESIDAAIWKAYLESDVVAANKRFSELYENKTWLEPCDSEESGD